MIEFCMNCGKVIDTEVDFLPITKFGYKFHHNCEKHYDMILKELDIVPRSKKSGDKS